MRVLHALRHVSVTRFLVAGRGCYSLRTVIGEGIEIDDTFFEQLVVARILIERDSFAFQLVYFPLRILSADLHIAVQPFSVTAVIQLGKYIFRIARIRIGNAVRDHEADLVFRIDFMTDLYGIGAADK